MRVIRKLIVGFIVSQLAVILTTAATVLLREPTSVIPPWLNWISYERIGLVLIALIGSAFGWFLFRSLFGVSWLLPPRIPHPTRWNDDVSTFDTPLPDEVRAFPETEGMWRTTYGTDIAALCGVLAVTCLVPIGIAAFIVNHYSRLIIGLGVLTASVAFACLYFVTRRDHFKSGPEIAGFFFGAIAGPPALFQYIAWIAE